jgi:hypothetical protein
MLAPLPHRHLITDFHLKPGLLRRHHLHAQTAHQPSALIDIPILSQRLIGFNRMSLAGLWVDIRHFTSDGSTSGKKRMARNLKAIPVIFIIRRWAGKDNICAEALYAEMGELVGDFPVQVTHGGEVEDMQRVLLHNVGISQGRE